MEFNNTEQPDIADDLLHFFNNARREKECVVNTVYSANFTHSNQKA